MEDLVIDQAFWGERRVLLTGHTGFKGTWLSLWLQSLQAEVRGLALDPASQPSFFESGQGVSAHRGYSRRYSRSSRRQSRGRCVSAGNHHPHGGAVSGSAILCRTSRHLRDQCHGYGPMCSRPRGTVRASASFSSSLATNVTKTANGTAATSKATRWAGTILTAAAKDVPNSSPRLIGGLFSIRIIIPSNRVALASARAGNVIGGGDWSVDRLIPDAMRAFMAGEEFVVRLS